MTRAAPHSVNLRRIDLNLLVALHALLEHRNVSRAAEALGLSQPAVSRMLARLRATLDDPLLVRTGRGMVPTPRALAIEAPLRRLLADAEAVVQPERFDPSKANAVIRMLANDAATEAVVAPWVRRLSAIAAELRFEIFGFSEAVRGDLARGVADFAIDVFPDPVEDCHVRHVFVDRYVCIVRAGHPVVRGRMTPELYTRLGHIQITGSGGVGLILERELARLDVHRRIVFRTPSMATAPVVIAQSDWVLTVPSARAVRSAHRFGVKILPVPYPLPPIPLSVLWHERTDRSPLHRWMLSELPEIGMPEE
jgi:DNA-binding transcriptional LysR family regulator